MRLKSVKKFAAQVGGKERFVSLYCDLLLDKNCPKQVGSSNEEILRILIGSSDEDMLIYVYGFILCT